MVNREAAVKVDDQEWHLRKVRAVLDASIRLFNDEFSDDSIWGDRFSECRDKMHMLLEITDDMLIQSVAALEAIGSTLRNGGATHV